MNSRCLNLPEIEKSLFAFRKEFAGLNARLSVAREDFTAQSGENILAAYRYMNELLQSGINIFDRSGLHSLLELNHLVLCGNDSKKRLEYHEYILETRTRFQNNIPKILKFYEKNKSSLTPAELAVHIYSRSLSQPQLFIEGNHRTGNVMINFILISSGAPVFIIDPENAFDYLELSADIKFTSKERLGADVMHFNKYRKRLIRILEKYCNKKFITG